MNLHRSLSVEDYEHRTIYRIDLALSDFNTESLKEILTFIDFYFLVNTKFWITNKKMFIKKFSDVTDVHFFISTIVNYKTFKNQKSHF